MWRLFGGIFITYKFPITFLYWHFSKWAWGGKGGSALPPKK